MARREQRRARAVHGERFCVCCCCCCCTWAAEAVHALLKEAAEILSLPDQAAMGSR